MKTDQSQPIMEKMNSLVDYLASRRTILAAHVRSKAISNSLLEYRKAMELATQVLKAKGTSITLIKDLARGMCAEKEANWEQAQIEYKANIALMETATKELNALQSMNRVVDSI